MTNRKALLGLAVAIVVAMAPAAWAANFTALRLRTDTGDVAPGDGICGNVVGECSLRAAIDEANALPGRDRIHLTGAVDNESAALVLDEIVITDDVDVVGDGFRQTRVAGVHLRRLLRVQVGVEVRISDLTLESGLADDGGIIKNDGTLELQRVHVNSGIAKRGGGVFNTGVLLATDCLFDSLVGQSPDGRGGAIYNSGQLVLDRVTIAKGQAVLGCGGAIYNAASGVVDATNTTLAKNNGRKGSGGAICNDGGAVRCTNCTIVRNRSLFAGGGVLNQGGSVQLVNTLLAQNTASGGISNCGGDAVISLGHNLDDGDSCAFSATGDISNSKPGLRSLEVHFDGYTPIVPLKSPHSVVVDAGDNSSCPGVDQRGWPRPSGAACDIGAIEEQEPVPTPFSSATITPTVTETSTPVPPSPTRTPSLTRTMSATRTPTLTASPDPSWSPTLSPTFDMTSTATETGTVTTTPTQTLTATPTLTPTMSATTTITRTVTSTATITATATLTATPTVTATPTITLTATATRTATDTRTPRPPGDFLVTMKASDAGDAVPGDGLCATLAGVCTLRAAIEEANESPSRDIIRLPIGAVPINGDLVITQDVDLVGSDMYKTVIDAAGNGRVVHVMAGASVTISDATLSDGYAVEGGVVLNEGSLSMDRCRLRSGKAERGAGMVNLGSATLTDVFFDGHTDAPPSGLGGCIHNTGSLQLNRVTLKRGQARLGCGGGIYNSSTGVIDAVNLTVMRNRSRLAKAGGICNEGGIFRCTNCTVARNQANNTAGGILNVGGTVELLNTIVADNFHGGYGRGANCAGDAVISLGHNIDSGDTCNFTAPGDQSNTDPRVRALHFIDGGRIPVGAFETTDSPAIDAADETACPALDGMSQLRPAGAACDIGSYEQPF